MTRAARKPMDKSLVKAIARLMHLHHQTHPNRLAERFGITPWYCRKIYGEMPLEDLPALREALKVFIAEPSMTLTDACQQANPQHSPSGDGLTFARG